MKIKHSINALSHVSFRTILVKNPITGDYTGEEADAWEDIGHSAAKGFEELQARIDELETKLAEIYTTSDIISVMEDASAKVGLEPEKPQWIPVKRLIKRKPKVVPMEESSVEAPHE